MRRPKYPHADETIADFYKAVSESYNSPSSGERTDGHKSQELLAEEFNISRIKVRKILITTGDLIYRETVTIREMQCAGKKMDEIGKEMGLKKSAINAYLPYDKGVYKLAEVSAAADRTALYRKRRDAIAAMHQFIQDGSLNEQQNALWQTIILFEDYPFVTSGRGKRPGVRFRYTVRQETGGGRPKYQGNSIENRGNELFIDGREKSISRSSVNYAYDIVQECRGNIKGPKTLKIYGSSYVYSLFFRFGLIQTAAALNQTANQQPSLL